LNKQIITRFSTKRTDGTITGLDFECIVKNADQLKLFARFRSRHFVNYNIVYSNKKAKQNIVKQNVIGIDFLLKTSDNIYFPCKTVYLKRI